MHLRATLTLAARILSPASTEASVTEKPGPMRTGLPSALGCLSGGVLRALLHLPGGVLGLPQGLLARPLDLVLPPLGLQVAVAGPLAAGFFGLPLQPVDGTLCAITVRTHADTSS